MKFESSQRSHIRDARLRKLKRAFCFFGLLDGDEDQQLEQKNSFLVSADRTWRLSQSRQSEVFISNLNNVAAEDQYGQHGYCLTQ